VNRPPAETTACDPDSCVGARTHTAAANFGDVHPTPDFNMGLWALGGGALT